MAKVFSHTIFTPLNMQVQSWQLRNQILTTTLRCKHRGRDAALSLVNPASDRQTFAEPLSGITQYQRRSQHLQNM